MQVNEIIKTIDEGLYDPHIFKAVFMAGGPGSGKSYIATSSLLKATGLKVVNSDDIFEYKMSKLGLDYEDPEVIYSPQGQETRDKAKITTDIKQNIYLDGRLGLIIDGTGRNEAKIAKAKEKLVKMGYSCMMLFVNTSLEVAQERNISREGRTIKPEEVEKMWRDVQDNIMKFQQLFGADKFQVIDNNGGLEDPTRKENFDVVAKNIDKFVNRPPSNRRAKEWIEDQKSKKNTTNQDNQ
jgi:cytidylate kinase|tara:strand:- start:84 stop:800 length:717 start_codon:yes stop_codon:yes gene_type:complete